MSTKQVGLRFHETMAGGVKYGETDYRTGEREGHLTGEVLSINLTVTIDDLEAFIADAKHEGKLTGCIDFSPFGSGLAVECGHFNLFFPCDDPRIKRMVYGLKFSHAGESYYLSGYKEIKDDPGFDLWSDTTTLFTRVHAGNDSSGRIVAAGVLTISVIDISRMVAGVQVLGADSVTDKVQTLACFGQFFLGELWDSYARYLP